MLKNKWILFIVVLGWFALIGQFYLIIINRTVSISETIIRYFSFFTILTNLLVAVCFTSLLIKKQKPSAFFLKITTLTAITVYILIVGIVYNAILRFLWNPEGLQKVVDELLHTVIPVLCLIFWWKYVRSPKLRWNHAFVWLIYPLLYILYILIRGAVSGFYPYPFINVATLGYEKVLINSGLLAVVFLITSFILIAIGRKTHSNKNN
jgi:hypothetical protein